MASHPLPMQTFFNGWRRQAGCVTLVVACVFAGGWIRNVIVTDQLEVVIGDSTHYITSTHGYFRWTRHAEIPIGSPSVRWYSIAHGSPWQPLDNEGAIQWRWRWDWYLFDFGGGLYRGFALTEWTFPCLLAIPLTGLSAALLILSPKKTPQAKAVAATASSPST